MAKKAGRRTSAKGGSAKKAARRAPKRSSKKTAKKASRSGRAPAARPMTAKREDLGAGAEVYLARLEDEVREVAEALHEQMMRAGETAAGSGRSFVCALKWGYPSYMCDGTIVAQLYDTKAGMAMRFLSGMRGPAPQLDDPEGLMDRSGKMPCVRVGSVDEAAAPGLRRIMASAVGG